MKSTEWLKSVENQSAQINRVLPSSVLLNSLRAIPASITETLVVRKRTVWMAAASIAFLIGLNIFSSLNYSQNSTGENVSTEQFTTDYFDYLKDINI
mgnify:CR=1 FL=1|tara:strand:+ start:203 stop:493 length:291 start_codon:yes stop_codon:yes gene_type:complete